MSCLPAIPETVSLSIADAEAPSPAPMVLPALETLFHITTPQLRLIFGLHVLLVAAGTLVWACFACAVWCVSAIFESVCHILGFLANVTGVYHALGSEEDYM